MNFKPVIKWSGSKRSQSEEIVNKIPNENYNTYYEPFCGGCSVLYQVLNSSKSFKNYVCSDINEDLINLWNLIKNSPETVYLAYREHWDKLNSFESVDDKRKYFNEVREKFNKEKNPLDFMFIMRTTTNGMPRYNKRGEFNNSFHLTRNGINPKTLKEIIFDWSQLLNKHNVQFVHQSYLKLKAMKNDFIYLDPPYANTNGMYYGGIDLEELWDFLRAVPCDYIMSFDGKTTTTNSTYNVPEDIYNEFIYLNSGNSSFRRILGKSKTEIVHESLYIKIKS